MIKVGTALISAVEQLEKEKGISKDAIIQSICYAMTAAYKKHIKSQDVLNIESKVNEATGEIGIFRKKLVVEKVEDELLEISLKDAKKIDSEVELEGFIYIDVTPDDFGRIAAQSAKQVIVQRIKEAERQLILDEFQERKGTLTTAVIQRIEGRNVIVNIGRTEAVLPFREQIPGEYYRTNDRIRVYVLDVKETTRLPQVVVSQVHPRIIQELFELEIPEIEDGLIEIVSIAREAGYRTKIAVASHDPEVDPIGSCIGPRGARIQTIVNELKNEKIDIVRYSDNPADYITNALSPARIISVEVIEDTPESRGVLVVVPDDQLSLAIGREGQNVRLAHRLTGWRIDIKSYSQMQAEEAQYNQEEISEEITDENQSEESQEQE